MEEVGPDTMVEQLTVTLATGDKQTLVDGVYGGQFSQDLLSRNPAFDSTKDPGPGNEPYLDINGNPVLNEDDAAKLDNPNYLLTLGPLRNGNGELHPDPPHNVSNDIGDTELYGSIQSIRDILTEKGEFSTAADVATDPNAAVKRGIPYYQKALDSLAFEFAQQMNELNNTGLTGTGNLFSEGSDTNVADHITASNISVSQNWANDTVSIQATADANAPSGDTSRLAEFLDLFNKTQEFLPTDMDPDAVGAPYRGTFEDMLLKIQSTLAEDQMSTDAVLNNYTITADNIYTDRDGVSGVDLNDEATGLMTYQKAYTAACRLMNVLNEALDSLINGTV